MGDVMKKLYRTVIFDFDGTLADTSEGIFNCVRYAQKKLNLPDIDEKSYRSFIGPPIAKSYNRVFNLIGQERDLAVAHHKKYSLERGAYEVTLYDGIEDLLKKLNDQNIRIGIATLKYQETAEKILQHLNLNKYFDVIRGATGEKKETKSTILESCILALGAPKSGCVLVGDSVYDAVGADDVMIDFIAVTYGFGFLNKCDAFKQHAIFAADNVDELTKILLIHEK